MALCCALISLYIRYCSIWGRADATTENLTENHKNSYKLGMTEYFNRAAYVSLYDVVPSIADVVPSLADVVPSIADVVPTVHSMWPA